MFNDELKKKAGGFLSSFSEKLRGFFSKPQATIEPVPILRQPTTQTQGGGFLDTLSQKLGASQIPIHEPLKKLQLQPSTPEQMEKVPGLKAVTKVINQF